MYELVYYSILLIRSCLPAKCRTGLDAVLTCKRALRTGALTGCDASASDCILTDKMSDGYINYTS